MFTPEHHLLDVISIADGPWCIPSARSHDAPGVAWPTRGIARHAGAHDLRSSADPVDIGTQSDQICATQLVITERPPTVHIGG